MYAFSAKILLLEISYTSLEFNPSHLGLNLCSDYWFYIFYNVLSLEILRVVSYSVPFVFDMKISKLNSA